MQDVKKYRLMMKKEMIVVVITVLLVCIGLSGCFEDDITGDFRGSFYVNDCGEPRGGFEYAAGYYANLTLSEGRGKLIFELEIGLGDTLEKHEYIAVLRQYTQQEMRLSIDGKQIRLDRVENDTMWNKWHNYYIASFGINMPESDRIGEIKPGIFPGLLDHYYVEIRLPEIE
jgi:hypothetical protein